MPRLRRTTALLIVASAVAHAATPSASVSAESAADATSNVIAFDELRRSYMELRRDVVLADRPQVVPGNSQIAVYVSMDSRATARLAAVSLEINGAVVGIAQYSAQQQDALRRGASATVYIGAIPPATSNLSATISGTRGDGEVFVKTTTLQLLEDAVPRFVEIELAHTQTKDVPDVVARVVGADEKTATSETACDWLLGCPTADASAIAADLQYRSVLYQTYQEQHERALVESATFIALAAGDTAARIQHRLAQLHAAIALDMQDVVEEIVTTPDAEQAGPRARIRFGFLHARDCHRRQAWPCLKSSLEEFDHARRELRDATPVSPQIDAEVSFMRAELATADGDFDRAQYIISTELSPKESFRAYALFNLGVTLRGAGIPTRAERVFGYLASMPVYTDDALDLKARARVALSAVNLQRTASASAEATLRDAPAEGRYYEQLMTSYGTRAMEHGDYELAARIWLTLARQTPWSSAGKTAQVAYPMCLEHIASPSVVLTQYRDAEAKFQQRIVDLDALTARTEDREWDVRLLHALARPEADASDPTLSEWRARIGHDDWLYWLNSDSTQVQLRQLRALDRITASLSDPVPAAFAARAHAIATNASRLAGDRRARLSRSIADMSRYEVDMARQQLGLIRVGIARASDRIADRNPVDTSP